MYIRDAVEKTEEYIKAMEEIRPILDREFPSNYMGMCYAVWNRKKHLLAERGIKWKTPAEMNPDIRWD